MDGATRKHAAVRSAPIIDAIFGARPNAAAAEYAILAVYRR